MKPSFTPGNNIAIKTPAHEFDATVEFYRSVLGFEQIQSDSPNGFESVTFAFGDKRLWIDRIDGISQAEIWLEIFTDDIAAAANYLGKQNCRRCDEIEPLPGNVNAFWLAGPSNIIHLIHQR